MKVYIKNMVCNLCCFAVINILKSLGLQYSTVNLGEVDFANYYGDKLPNDSQKLLFDELDVLGFSVLSDKKSILIETIKISCLDYLKQMENPERENLSKHITNTIPLEYNYLSNIFSVVEGITIEQYFIRLRVEQVKEFLVYDELTTSEISFQLGYSSVAHLSAQFKKITGLTPGHFRLLKNEKLRSSLDKL